MYCSKFLPLFLFLLVFLESCYVRATNVTAAIFVIGDSLYDPGNNNYLNVSLKANFPPYGETFFRYPSGRFCDGRQVTDFISEDAKLPLWFAYLDPVSSQFITNGANFASGGAGVLDSTSPGTLSLRIQIDYLEKVSSIMKKRFGAKIAKNLMNKAVYLMSIGGDDYTIFYQSYPDATELEQNQFIDSVIGNLSGAIKRVYELGGRKFAFQNVGPIGCAPSVRQSFNGSCDELLQVIARKHNIQFAKIITELEEELSGFKYSNFDYFTSLYDRIKNPTKYGFVGSGACCGTGAYRGTLVCGDLGVGSYELCENPKDFVFFDGAHPSEACNKQIAELFWNGSSNVTEPMNLRQLYELDLEVKRFGENQTSSLADE